MNFNKLIREPTESELKFFKNNKNVGGYAADDNKIVHNPYKNLTNNERNGITINEGTRIYLRNNPIYQQLLTNYKLNNEQNNLLKNYSNNKQDINDTIAGRYLSNDPSINNYTIDQHYKLNLLKLLMNGGI